MLAQKTGKSTRSEWTERGEAAHLAAKCELGVDHGEEVGIAA